MLTSIRYIPVESRLWYYIERLNYFEHHVLWKVHLFRCSGVYVTIAAWSDWMYTRVMPWLWVLVPSCKAAMHRMTCCVSHWTVGTFVTIVAGMSSPYLCTISLLLQRGLLLAGFIWSMDCKPIIRVYSLALEISTISGVPCSFGPRISFNLAFVNCSLCISFLSSTPIVYSLHSNMHVDNLDIHHQRNDY